MSIEYEFASVSLRSDKYEFPNHTIVSFTLRLHSRHKTRTQLSMNVVLADQSTRFPAGTMVVYGSFFRMLRRRVLV